MIYGQNSTFELSEAIISKVVEGCKPSEIEAIIKAFIAPLEHHKDSTVGLWATDQEQIEDDKGHFFKIEF